ncbi:translation initiation factor IF-5A [Candidatus Pacearchaeota archaeon]|nr:translation initiation factor IF-5A [Candidatus Pacearchaeota archaeon]
MVLKIIDATQARSGQIIMIDSEPYNVRSNDISKTGKHGHAKCRMEAIGVFTGKKKVLVVPGHERFDVPNVEKKRAQVLSVSGDKASVMDLESYETLDFPFDESLRDQIVPDKQVEIWDIEGYKKIMRVL